MSLLSLMQNFGSMYIFSGEGVRFSVKCLTLKVRNYWSKT